MAPFSDQPGFCQHTSGDIPPKLVGASTTVIGSKVYLFGGCLVNTTQVFSTLYTCDLVTYRWERIPLAPDDSSPPARCFHSADSWNGQLIIFGGFGSYQAPLSSDEPCLLNDIQIYDIASNRWLPPQKLNAGITDLVERPRPRHSHLSAISADCLFIIGGEEATNTWLDDIYVYDLGDKAWIQQWHYPRPCGTYLNVAACGEEFVRIPFEGSRAWPMSPPTPASPSLLLSPLRSSRSSSPTSPDPSPLSLSTTFLDTRGSLPGSPISSSPSHLPYSMKPSEEFPCDIFIYSNYNSTHVKRKLETFSPPLATDFTIRDQSRSLTGSPSPPLLRFPSGVIVGTHFIIAGTCLGSSSQYFSIWALDLQTLTWSHIDTGSEIAYGSWFQGRLWRDANKWIMFGDRNGNIANDYGQRLSSWEHIAIVDLETFGIYQPPPLELALTTQELCLTALEEAVETDYEFICNDGQRIKCSRRLVEGRWPWFGSQISKLLDKIKLAMEIRPASAAPRSAQDDPSTTDDKLEPRITSRSFNMAAPYTVTLALLQYFYTLALLTPLQQTPVVLSELLSISTTYNIPHLTTLVKHAMHMNLSETTCDEFYDATTRCGCHSLKVRAFRYVLSYRQRGAPGRVKTKIEQQSMPALPPRNHGTRSVSRPPPQPLPDVQVTHHSPGVAAVEEVLPLHPLQPHRGGSRMDMNTPTPHRVGSRLDMNTPTPNAPSSMSTSSSEGIPVKKAKKAKVLLNKIFRSASVASTSSGGSSTSKSLRTGGGGRTHAAISSRVSKADKIRAIEAAMNGTSAPTRSEAERVIDRDLTPVPFPVPEEQHHHHPASPRIHASRGMPTPTPYEHLDLDVMSISSRDPAEEQRYPDRRGGSVRSKSSSRPTHPPSYFSGSDSYLDADPSLGPRRGGSKQMYSQFTTGSTYF